MSRLRERVALRAAIRAEQGCRSACPGPRECPCQCHDAADRVRALMRERFGSVVDGVSL